MGNHEEEIRLANEHCEEMERLRNIRDVNMKKLLNHFIIYTLAITSFLGLWFCQWQRVTFWWWELNNNMPYSDKKTDSQEKKDNTNLWDLVSVKERDDTIIVKLLCVFWLDNSIEKWRDLKFIDYARAIINMALWLVAFIALLMSIYTFYMMFFSENEAGIKKAKWNLVGIFIALGILGLAWIIVSFIFRWYQSNRKENETNLLPSNEVISSNYIN